MIGMVIHVTTCFIYPTIIMSKHRLKNRLVTANLETWPGNILTIFHDSSRQLPTSNWKGYGPQMVRNQFRSSDQIHVCDCMMLDISAACPSCSELNAWLVHFRYFCIIGENVSFLPSSCTGTRSIKTITVWHIFNLAMGSVFYRVWLVIFLDIAR